MLLLPEGDPRGIYELLLWSERIHRYWRLLYCDDAKRLEAVNKHRCGKQPQQP